MPQLNFTKMHGLGNDYVYLDGLTQDLSSHDLPALARRLADRHFGVGGDGMIAIVPADAPGAHARMRMFNIDGSEGEMCGNGIRCVAKLILDDDLLGGGHAPAPVHIQTGAGVLALHHTAGADGTMQSVAVDMGEPIFEPQQIPIDLSADGVLEHVMLGPAPRAVVTGFEGAAQTMVCVSFGNPHGVLFVDDLALLTPGRLRDEGRALETHAVFPNHANIHFVQVLDRDRVRVLHWERGSGATLACGTGATAVCVASHLAGQTERRITAELPGGELELEWRDDNHVVMTGPATRVFDGRIQI